MPVHEAQFDTWSHQGSVTQSSTTYAAVKACLESRATAYATKDYAVFLQGSYGNDTNIYAESDVDIVIRLDSTYHYNIDSLSSEEKNTFHTNTGGPATYSFADFKRDVTTALMECYADDVAVGKKAVTIASSANRRKADVIVTTEFRRYRSYSIYRTDDYVSGICFFTYGSERVVNYPRQHSANVTAKHQATNSWYKPAVRILKNMRSCMEAEGRITPGLAPSYFLEGLLYNVPNGEFGGSYERTIVAAVNWILGADRSQFACANEEYYLLRAVPHVCWNPSDCDAFLAALVTFWDDWH